MKMIGPPIPKKSAIIARLDGRYSGGEEYARMAKAATPYTSNMYIASSLSLSRSKSRSTPNTRHSKTNIKKTGIPRAQRNISLRINKRRLGLLFLYMFNIDN